jgi:hypothetical protein
MVRERLDEQDAGHEYGACLVRAGQAPFHQVMKVGGRCWIRTSVG